MSSFQSGALNTGVASALIANKPVYTKVVANFGGTVTSIEFSARSSTGVTCQMGLYDDVSGAPHALLGATAAAIAVTPNVVNTGSIVTPFPIINGHTYWTALVLNLSVTVSGNSVAPTSLAEGGTSNPTLPAIANPISGGTNVWQQVNGIGVSPDQFFFGA